MDLKIHTHPCLNKGTKNHLPKAMTPFLVLSHFSLYVELIILQENEIYQKNHLTNDELNDFHYYRILEIRMHYLKAFSKSLVSYFPAM